MQIYINPVSIVVVVTLDVAFVVVKSAVMSLPRNSNKPTMQQAKRLSYRQKSHAKSIAILQTCTHGMEMRNVLI